MNVVVRYFLKWAVCINRVILGINPRMTKATNPHPLIPAKAGIHNSTVDWIPAFAGKSGCEVNTGQIKCWTRFENAKNQAAAAPVKTQGNLATTHKLLDHLSLWARNGGAGTNSEGVFLPIVPRQTASHTRPLAIRARAVRQAHGV